MTEHPRWWVDAEWHAERWRALHDGPEPEPQPGDPGYTPDPTEYME